jgi:hypothetical protein
MSTHPNVLLIAVLTTNDLSRNTMLEILEEAGAKKNDKIRLPGGKAETVEDRRADREALLNAPNSLGLYHTVMENDYDEGWQISAKEGDLVFLAMLTYGYGEYVLWDALASLREILDEWCKGVCERHRCKYEIRISANYW